MITCKIFTISQCSLEFSGNPEEESWLDSAQLALLELRKFSCNTTRLIGEEVYGHRWDWGYLKLYEGQELSPSARRTYYIPGFSVYSADESGFAVQYEPFSELRRYDLELLTGIREKLLEQLHEGETTQWLMWGKR